MITMTIRRRIAAAFFHIFQYKYLYLPERALKRIPSESLEILNGNEKYYYLPEFLPTNSQRPGNIHAGDLMLYGSDCLVLFYESFPSGYSYTRLRTVDDPNGLAAALGSRSVKVIFQIA